MPKPRRIRFTAEGLTLNGVEPERPMHFMAYTQERAEELARSKGYEFTRMLPYRQAVRREHANNGDYRLDQSAVQEAIEFYGLKLPVRIRYSSKVGPTRGNHALGRRLSGPNFHDVMLKTYIGAEQASKTLWHELTHAMQAEREILAAGGNLMDPAAKSHWYAADARGKGVSYLDKPIEVEAREGEAMHEALPLAVKV